MEKRPEDFFDTEIFPSNSRTTERMQQKSTGHTLSVLKVAQQIQRRAPHKLKKKRSVSSLAPASTLPISHHRPSWLHHINTRLNTRSDASHILPS